MPDRQLGQVMVDGATVVVAICAIAVTARVFFGTEGPPRTPLYESRTIEDWEALLDDAHVVGSAEPRMTVIEFGDYECPACRSFHPVIKAFLDDNADQVSFAYRHLPLSYHRYAYAAARAAECAGDQGRFWEFHEFLYTEDDWLGDAFREFAIASDVHDLTTFEECLAAQGDVPRIERDIRAARALNSFGTPTIIVNGTLLGSPPTASELQAFLDAVRGDDK